MTDGVPSTCPTCGTNIPPGATRCPGCGRVFGEDNRCPHCNAIAAVRPAGAGWACTACGKPRDRKPGTTVRGEPEPRSSRVSIVPEAATSGLRGGFLRFIGASGIGGGILGAGLATLLFGTGVLGITAALVLGGAGVLVGATAFRRARTLDERAKEKERRALEARILSIASRHGGELTATIVAADLGVKPEDAERALSALVDGTRVELEVDETDGTMHYLFREARPSVTPKVRVAGEAEPAIDEEQQAEIEREVERVKKRRL